MEKREGEPIERERERERESGEEKEGCTRRISEDERRPTDRDRPRVSGHY